MKKITLVVSFVVLAFSFSKAQQVTTFAGSTTSGSADGTGTAAGFYHPTSVATDDSGNMYVADMWNNEIRKINIATGAVTTLAGSGTAGHADGVGITATFFNPTGIVADSGNLYVSDGSNNEIRKIVLSTGVVTTLAGSTTAGFADGTGTNASFNYPNGITKDQNGNLFVSDASNNEIRQIVISSGVVSTLAGSTTAGFADGTGTNASFNGPNVGTVDVNGNLYIADGNNNEIRQIVISTGVVTTIAGSTTAGSNDGIGAAAGFNQPSGATIDGNGNLYVPDASNNKIRKVVISTGAVTTIAGSVGAGSADGISTAASFNNPASICSDVNGNLYVADWNNHEIRKIAEPTCPNIFASVGGKNSVCYGLNDTLIASITGGISPFNVYWNNVQLSDTLISNAVTSNLADTLVAVDAAGCHSDTSIVNVTVDNPGSFTIVNDGSAVLCPGNSTFLQAMGGNASQFAWTPSNSINSASPTLNNVNANPIVTTTYTVTGVDYQGCFAPSDTFVVTVGTPPVVTIVGNVLGGMNICSGIADTLQTIVTGTGPYSYFWNTESNSPSIVVFSSGEYNVAVTDGNGCQNSADSIVNSGNSPALVVSGGGTVCSGSAANMNVTGAESYMWAPNVDFVDPTDSLQSITPGSSTTYTVTGSNGACKSNQQVFITVEPLPMVGISGANSVCSGSNISLFGTGADVYQWTGGPNSPGYQVAPLFNTTYTVTGTTLSSGCTNTATQVVNVNPLPIISVSGSTTICYGSSTPLTEHGAINYNWSPGNFIDYTSDSTIMVNPGSTSTYTVSGTNLQGCSGDTVVVITVNPTPTIMVSGKTSVCMGDSTNLTASGGVSYAWSPSTGLSNISNGSVMAGPATQTSYMVSGTNSYGCSSNSFIQLYVNSNPNVNISGNNTACSGNPINLNANVGNSMPPFSYNWLPTGGNNSSANNVPAGTYTCNVTDGNGCNGSGTVTVTINPNPTITVTGSLTVCRGDSTSLNASGANTYSWQPPFSLSDYNTAAVMAAPSSPTTFTVSGVDANGCMGSTLVNINVNPLPNITVSGNNTVCKGSNTTLTANGASTYTWAPAASLSSSVSTSPVASPTVTTNYTITGTDANGCVNSTTTQLFVNTPAPITANAFPSSSVCAGDQIVLYGSGASVYSWSGGVNDGVSFRPSASGTYTVSSFSNNCTSTDTIQITVNPLPVISVSASPNDTICQGGSVSLTASGASSYTWNKGVVNGALFSPASSDIYAVTATDVNGCSSSKQVPVTIVNLPSITGSASPQTVCQGGSVTLTGSGGVSYNWTGGVNNGVAFVPASSGSYTVTGSNAAGCTNTAIVGVTVNPVPVIGDSAIPSTSVCQGTSVALLGKGGSSYSWSGGVVNGSTFVPSVTSTYTVIGYGANGCTSKDSITITVNSKIIATPIYANTTCGLNNGSVKVLASNGTQPYSYVWSTTPAQTTDSIGGLSPGIYVVTVGDPQKCNTYVSVNIASSTSPILSVSTNASSCGNASGSATVGAIAGTPPYRYQWSNGDTLSQEGNLTLGTYIITVTDANKCSSFISAVINNLNGPSIASNNVTNVGCNGQATGSISINIAGGVPPYRFVWSNGATTQNITNLAAGPYQVTVTDKDSCATLGSYTVTQPSAISITKAIIKANCGVSDGAGFVTVNGGTPPYTYLWNNGRTSDSIRNVPAAAYYVTIIDHNNCIVDSSQVSVSNINGPVVGISVTGSASCNSGGVTLKSIVNGGSAPYTYMWSTNNTNSSISQIPAGKYNVVVTDHLSCIGVTDTAVYEVPPPVAPICMVTVDSTTGKNMIIWDKAQPSGIASYNIYKESTQAGVYLKIGNVPYKNLSVFIDTLSNPQTRSWRYEISELDSCGNESALSSPHKTMHLTVNQGIGGVVNLIWDNYQGMNFSTYYVYRDSVSNGLTLIDSIPNNIYTYTDAKPLKSKKQYYRIEVVNPNPCNPTARTMAVNYNSSKSNTGNLTFDTVTSVANVNGGINTLNVYPNPSTGVFTLTLSSAKGYHNVSLSVVNTLGQVVSTESYSEVPTTFSKQMDLSSLAKGVYFLKVVSDNSTMYNKLVIQ